MSTNIDYFCCSIAWVRQTFQLKHKLVPFLFWFFRHDMHYTICQKSYWSEPKVKSSTFLKISEHLSGRNRLPTLRKIMKQVYHYIITSKKYALSILKYGPEVSIRWGTFRQYRICHRLFFKTRPIRFFIGRTIESRCRRFLCAQSYQRLYHYIFSHLIIFDKLCNMCSAFACSYSVFMLT